MNTKKLRILILLMILTSSVMFYSCSSSSSIVGSWKNPAYSGKKFSKIVVIAVAKNPAVRSTMEKEIVARLKDSKITAVSGTDIIPENIIKWGDDNKVTEESRAMIVERIKQNNIDGGLVIALKDIKDSEHYVPGTVYTPYAGHHSFYNYYYTGYGTVYSPGYVEKTTQVFLQSNLYDISKDELLWSAQSETYNPSSLKELASSYSGNLVSEMLEKGILK